MGAAGANENFYLWSRFSSLDMCPEEEQEKKNRRAELLRKSLEACALKEHNPVLTDNVRGGHSPDVRQHIQHLLIRQFAAKAVHRAEQHAIRDRHEQFPIALGLSDWGPKTGRPYDQILAIRAFPIQLSP